jgi:plasmid stabilization system protein ParE
MARVVVPRQVRGQLRHVVASRSLPSTTYRRVNELLAHLGTYPRLGSPLAGEHAGYRYVVGPKPWLLIVYRYDAALDQVDVIAIQDSRTADAWTAER